MMNPSCTLSGILAFAQYCHDLVHLHLSLDATELVVPEPAAIPFPCAHQRLRTLHVADSPIKSPERVASFLTRFFPNGSYSPSHLTRVPFNLRYLCVCREAQSDSNTQLVDTTGWVAYEDIFPE